jgi:hypothetical protein
MDIHGKTKLLYKKNKESQLDNGRLYYKVKTGGLSSKKYTFLLYTISAPLNNVTLRSFGIPKINL